MTESGRTLVETLGILAIMGILSVVGIKGFHKAMDKHKANTLIQEAQKRAVIVAGQIGMNGNTPSLAEFEPYQNTSAGTFDSKVYYNEGGLNKQFGIKVDEVEKSVCQNVLNTLGEASPIRRLSKEDTLISPITACEEGKSAYIIIYNEDMTANNKVEPPTTCKNESECQTECATCQIETGAEEGVCIAECDSACEEGDTCGDNECVVCDSKTKTCQNQCEEVEYLESTGMQYIDTLIESLTSVSVKFALGQNNTTQYIYGLNNLSSWEYGINASIGNNTATTFKIRVCQKGRVIDGSDFIYRAGDIYTIESRLGSRPKVNNQPHANGWGSEYSNPTGSMILFGERRNGSIFSDYLFAGSIYFFQLYNDSALVRDFIPVLSPQSSKCKGKPSMFDKISKKLFCNAGSGDFTAGPSKSN